jgi:uncharacterized protein (DUF2342 family)
VIFDRKDAKTQKIKEIGMSWLKKKAERQLDVEQLRRVVALIPEYVDALIDERMGARAIAEGLDGRELHGPAERKLKKIEARLAGILGIKRKVAEAAEVRSAVLPGAILTDEQRGK